MRNKSFLMLKIPSDKPLYIYLYQIGLGSQHHTLYSMFIDPCTPFEPWRQTFASLKTTLGDPVG